MLHEIGQRVGWRWINLWRDTDPIGGWIFAAHRPGTAETLTGPPATVDRRLKDPQDVVPPPSDSVPPPILAHCPCESQEEFAESARELTGTLRPARLPPPADPAAGYRHRVSPSNSRNAD